MPLGRRRAHIPVPLFAQHRRPAESGDDVACGLGFGAAALMVVGGILYLLFAAKGQMPTVLGPEVRDRFAELKQYGL